MSENLLAHLMDRDGEDDSERVERKTWDAIDGRESETRAERRIREYLADKRAKEAR